MTPEECLEIVGAAIVAAILAEREACAKLIESQSLAWTGTVEYNEPTPQYLETCALRDHFAKLIRGRAGVCNKPE